jgi:hypothetical protein
MLFPLQDLYEYLAKYRPGIERDGLTLHWPDYEGVTELRVEPIEHHTHDNLTVRERVTVTHTAPGLKATPKVAATLNRWATLSALLPYDNPLAPAQLVCKVGIFDGDREAAERLYAPLVASEAALIGWHAARLARGPLEIDPDQSPLIQVKDPSPFGLPDLEKVKDFTDQLEAMSSVGGSAFTVEFPWDDGALSRSFALPELRAKFLQDSRFTDEDLDRLAGRTSVSVRPTRVDGARPVQCARTTGRQRCGSSSSMRLAGWVGSRSSTSLR